MCMLYHPNHPCMYAGSDDLIDFHVKYCRVHKPGVPRGPATPQRLGPSRQCATHGPAQESKHQVRRTIQSPTGRSGRGGTAPAFPTPATSPTGAPVSVTSPPPDDLSDRKAWQSTTSDSDSDPTSPTGTHKNPALLRLGQPELTGTNRQGTPTQKGPRNERRKQGKAHKSNHDTRDHTLYTYRNSTLQPP